MPYPKIVLKKGKEESLLRFHPWIFSGAIHHIDDGVKEGDVVSVYTAGGEFIANGHFQQGTIAVRVLTFDDITIDGKTYKGFELQEGEVTGTIMAREENGKTIGVTLANVQPTDPDVLAILQSLKVK